MLKIEKGNKRQWEMSVRPLATPLLSPPPTRTVAILPFQLLQNARNERWENVGEHRPSGPSGVSPPPSRPYLSLHACRGDCLWISITPFICPSIVSSSTSCQMQLTFWPANGNNSTGKGQRGCAGKGGEVICKSVKVFTIKHCNEYASIIRNVAELHFNAEFQLKKPHPIFAYIVYRIVMIAITITVNKDLRRWWWCEDIKTYRSNTEQNWFHYFQDEDSSSFSPKFRFESSRFY